MQRGFAELIKSSWLRLLADKGDDILITWLDGTVLEGADDLTESFRENQGILSMLLGVRFAAEDKKFLTRVKVQARNQRRMLDNSIANLLGEETTTYSETTDRAELLEEASFIVRKAAITLNMPTENIKLNS